MKKILLSAAVVFAFATPGFAKTYSAQVRELEIWSTCASRENERHIRIFRNGSGAHWRCFDRPRSKRHFGLRLLSAEFPPAQSAQ